MTRLTLSNPSVPESFQSMFRQMVQPWRMDDAIFDAMFRPAMGYLEPGFGQSLDAMTRSLTEVFRLRQDLLGGMHVHVDVVEKNGGYKVSADLPGMKKEDISVRIDGNVVNIEAHTVDSAEVKDEAARVLFNERHYGSVSRTFTLGEEVDETQAVGKYVDGVLTLDLPKKPSAPKHEARAIMIH